MQPKTFRRLAETLVGICLSGAKQAEFDNCLARGNLRPPGFLLAVTAGGEWYVRAHEGRHRSLWVETILKKPLMSGARAPVTTPALFAAHAILPYSIYQGCVQ